MSARTRASPRIAEAARLAEVRRYQILDTEREVDFDEIATLAAGIFDAPISAVSIVADDRQWFKSIVGLDIEETPRSLSFCSHAIERPDELFVVEDASTDARFADNALVTGDSHFRFYAGMPVVTPAGLALGALCVIDTVPRTVTQPQAEALKTLARQVAVQVELRHNAREMRQREAEVSASLVDVDERRRENRCLRDAYERDALTGLLSRAGFERVLGEMHAAHRRGGRGFAVIVLDVDDFHAVNASYGVASGDALLRAVGTLLTATCSAATVGRLYADKFGLLIAYDEDAEASLAARSLIDGFGTPFSISGEPVYLTASAGVALASDAVAPWELMAEADTARRHARGGNTFRIYTPQMNEAAAARALLRENVRQALEKDHFELYYQPKIDLATRATVGCEALLRWNHPERGPQPPAEFVPIAERTGSIVTIGEWVIREACRQYAAWRNDGSPAVPIALNVSAVQLARSNVPEFIAGVLREYDVPATALELEIAEDTLLDCSDELIAQLRAIRDLGMSVALDDFGTGFSSLAYLHRLPLSVLKVHQMFVRGAQNNPSDVAIVRSMVHLARQFGLRTVAEGVETSEQLSFVIECGCDEAQGYYFSAPMSAGDFALRMRSSTIPVHRNG